VKLSLVVSSHCSMKKTTHFGACHQKRLRLFFAKALHLRLFGLVPVDLCDFKQKYMQEGLSNQAPAQEKGVESAPTSMSAHGLPLIFRRSQYQGHCACEALLLREIVSGLLSGSSCSSRYYSDGLYAIASSSWNAPAQENGMRKCLTIRFGSCTTH